MNCGFMCGYFIINVVNDLIIYKCKLMKTEMIKLYGKIHLCDSDFYSVFSTFNHL